MSDFTKDNNKNDEENIIMPGQMCYDELDPIIEKKEIKQAQKIAGQLSLMELDTNGNNKSKGSENLDRIDDEKINDEIKLESSQEENILDEIERDKKSRKRESKKSQIKFDLDSAGNDNRIILNALEEVLHNSMIPYTEHVVLDRALPRVEDGLKPVQRRILYTMLELGLEPEKQFRKSARIVGDCMGKYHPHGDSSVYDAMVRMSQSFSLREPLVLGHGNFGSIDGDSAAAMRYTEAKLTPLAMELLKDLEKNTVAWNLNFDDTLKEPATLPGKFPNLLVNGASGIAVGVATNIPPHNLTEVIEGVIAFINNPKITLEEMMKIIKGPDFPTGGIVYVGNELEQAYRTGKGKIIIRSKIDLEEKADRKTLVITEIPYQTNKATLLQKIAELRENNNKGILAGVVEIRDESDRKGMRAIIRLKKEANEKIILDYLYRQTGLETTFGINMVAIAGGKPRQMGILEIISYYAEYQRQVIYRRTKYDLDQAKERAHILEGLLVAIKNIDEVIKIIKASASVSDAKLKLRAKFQLSEKQAQAILDMRLARLVNLEVTKLIEELKQLKERIAQLTKIYESKKLQNNVVKTELSEIKRKYKSNRRSVIDKRERVVETTKVKEEPIVIENDVILAITADNMIKSISVKNYNLSQKDVNENTTLSYVHTQLLTVKNTKKILIFTDKGNCYKTIADNVPDSKWRDKGAQLKAIDKKISSEESPVKIIEMPENLDKKELIFFTASGMVKRSSLTDYDIAKSYFQAIKMKDDDKVINVEFYEDKGSILIVSKNTMVLNFEKTDIPVQGRVTGGVKGIGLDDSDSVIYGTQITRSGNLTIMTDRGFAKSVPVAEFGLSARYRKGLRAISLNGKGKGLIFADFTTEKDYIAINLGDKIKLVEDIEVENRLSEGKQKIKENILSASKYYF
ncbi:MAG: DNA topoisomerase 4 subunit A [Clostridia bacterium]|nr:DNA topoisomerase 4 subunit A [Clostridia bacterium]